MKILAWDLNLAAAGKRALLRHDESKFDGEFDSFRAARESDCLGFRIAVIQVRGDWPALCEMAGYRTWSHNVCPCFLCNIPKKSSAVTNNIGLASAPWQRFTRAQYDAEVARCSVLVTIPDVETRSRVSNACNSAKISWVAT